MKKLATLLTHNDLELPCVVLSEKSLFPVGKEVIVYAQNRLVRGYIEDDDSLVAELEIVVEFAIIPELEEIIKENSPKQQILTTEIYYV
jgi:hypothetical protein